jgi:hypothetical protein
MNINIGCTCHSKLITVDLIYCMKCLIKKLDMRIRKCFVVCKLWIGKKKFKPIPIRSWYHIFIRSWYQETLQPVAKNIGCFMGDVTVLYYQKLSIYEQNTKVSSQLVFGEWYMWNTIHYINGVIYHLNTFT